MILNKGMSRIQLLEFGKKTSGNISRSLEGTEKGLDRFLPGFNILTSRSGGEDICGSEAGIRVDFGDDVEGFHHDEFVFGDFL